MVIALVALDLFAHDSDVLVDLRGDTVDAGLCEGDASTMCSEVCGTARGTLQPAAGNLNTNISQASTRRVRGLRRTMTGTEHFCETKRVNIR